MNHYERRRPRRGVSLAELIAIVTILGILAMLIVPRFSNHASDAKKKGCSAVKGNIEVQCQLWLRQKGTAPQSNLSDIGANTSYFPDGQPNCPVDGTAYTVNTTTLRVNGHTH